MGLSITRSIAVAHGGAAWLESTYGEGATFFVAVPLDNHVLEADDGHPTNR
jgi:signal transduction histidine kinase